MKRFRLLLIALAALSCAIASYAQTTLKEAYKDAFKIGVAIGRMQTSGRIPQATDLVLKHFNSISPEN
ncbi:MAG: endo-1,4-beta-xylanase, partial [Bacteroidales bacterium]|nr:endo-1,4-beta-xylanase [Bacteroidales bacterium]